ncbi:MAG: hypothetical protein AAGC78_01170 [Cellvibrio sp.]|uniref:hypothetical protein n=1 Tax=Cellvibrio sp. TaxID=1965322 RepID=UPI0031AB1261
MKRLVGILIPLTLLLSACAARLAPSYDKAIADGLVASSQQLMTHFAATSAGTTASSFAQRDATYSSLIGNLDALALQAKSRPSPKVSVSDKVNKYLAERGINLSDTGEVPSAAALEQISITLTKMRDVDKKQGVTAFEVAAFKGQVVIYLDQALTYENFLEREGL